MALLKVICWAIIFITRLRFPPGKSLATTLNEVNSLKEEVCELKTINKQLMDYVDTLEKTDYLQ